MKLRDESNEFDFLGFFLLGPAGMNSKSFKSSAADGLGGFLSAKITTKYRGRGKKTEGNGGVEKRGNQLPWEPSFNFIAV